MNGVGIEHVESLYDALRHREVARWGDSNDAEIEALNDALDEALQMLESAGIIDPEMVAAIEATDPEDFED